MVGGDWMRACSYELVLMDRVLGIAGAWTANPVPDQECEKIQQDGALVS